MTRRPGTLSRVRLVSRASFLAVGMVVLLPVLATAALASPAGTAAPLTISSDAGGAALVNGSNLAPGPMSPRCILISYTDATADDELRLFAATGGAELADLIDLTLEVGAGGQYGDCTGFTGSTVYAGTLGEFGRSHGTAVTSLRLTAIAAGSGDVSFRFRFAVHDDNRAQGLSTSADFIWAAGQAAPTAETPDPSPPVETPAPESPAPSPTTSPAPAETFIPESTVVTPFVSGPKPSATSGRTKQPSKSAAPGATAEKGNAPKSESPLVAGVKAIGKYIGRASQPVAKGLALGVGMIPLVLVFLTVQGFIDRREPKLANAPAYAEPDLPFGNSPRAASR